MKRSLFLQFTRITSRPRKSHKLLHHHKLDLTPVVYKEIQEIVHDVAPDHRPIAVSEIQIDIGKAEHRVVFSDRLSSGESQAMSGNGTASFGDSGSMPEVLHLGWGRWYTFRELETATNGLSVIDGGGHGIVYGGVLADSTRVAVKNLLNDRDTKTFNTLIKGFCLNGNKASALKFFDENVENGFQPNVITCGIIMNGLCKIGNTSAVILLLRKMEKIGGFEPGLVQYSMVIDSLCKDRLVTEAFKLFLEMIGKVISPDVITYTSLIQGVSSLGEWEEATRLLNEMVGKKIWPNVKTFNILVDALCKEGKAKKAQDVVELMIQRGVVPSVVTYNSVMDGYCLCGQADDARKMYDVMVSRGCAPDAITYNILINGYCKIKNIDEAMSLFKEMSRKRLLPDRCTFAS
ncbi:unnamed protein product [Camellia sinensis]